MSRSRRADAEAVACSSCGMPVVWCYTKSGARMPCDPELVRILIDDGSELAGAVVAGRISHFATCPYAPAHRRSRAEGEPGKGQERASAAAPEDQNLPQRVLDVGLVVRGAHGTRLTEILHDARVAADTIAAMRRSGPSAIRLCWADSGAPVTRGEARELGLL